MASGPVSFGSYTFPATVAEWRSNFGDGVPTTTRLPGMSGGWNENGTEPLPSAIGTVTMGFKLIAATRAAMDDLRDAVMAMRAYGLQQLVYQPTDPADSTRFCWAHVHNISMPQRKDLNTDYWQDVKIIFHVPDPVWRSGIYGGLKWSDALLWSNSLKWGDNTSFTTCNGTSTSFGLTNQGNAPAVCGITLTPPAGKTAQNPRIQRIVSGAIVDEVAYTGTISYGQQLEIDGRKGRINVSGGNAFANASYLHPDFFRLMPGVNSIRVLMTGAADQAVIYIEHYYTYR